MTHDPILRPPSVASRDEQMQRLLRKGYFPVTVIPKAMQQHFSVETGPSLTGGLLKVPKGTVDTASSPVGTYATGRGCLWGPVVYVVLWKTLIRKRAPRGLQEDDYAMFPKLRDNSRLQLSILSSYVLTDNSVDHTRDVLRQAIDGAILLLRRSERLT